MKIQGNDDSLQEIHFQQDTRISIPMRNLRREARFKGCAFQVESSEGVKVFMANSLAEKNVWARKLNIVLGELRKSGDYAPTADENAPITPAFSEKAAVPFSADRATRQRAAVQQLAQSLQPRRTLARTPAAAVVSDRSAEIAALEHELDAREQALEEKQRELSETLQKLHREQQYREQITSGVEKWRQEMTRQKDQKLQDTRERLEEESSRVKELEKEKGLHQAELRDRDAHIGELEAAVASLRAEVESGEGLRAEIKDLRVRLDKEMAFVQVLERDTQQMAEELMRMSRDQEELREKHENDTESYRTQVGELRQQLAHKEEEALEMKEEMAHLRQENRRLQEAQSRMHREFFFSLALSIKLSLAQQGIYSNADLNLLYEQILSEPYGQWTQAIEQKLKQSQLEDTSSTPARQNTGPSPRGSAKKKGLFGLF